MIFERDLSNLCEQCEKELPTVGQVLSTAASFLLAVALVTLMGWTAITTPPPQTPSLMTPEQLKLHTEQAMAAYSAATMREMEKRTQK